MLLMSTRSEGSTVSLSLPGASPATGGESLLPVGLAPTSSCVLNWTRQYATGLRKDCAAVQHSLLYPEISNGPREGMNSRIKMRHRRGGGRAGIELRNAYNVLNAADLTG